MKKLFIRLFDWTSAKLDESACKALEKAKPKTVILYRETVILRPKSFTERIWRQESLEEIESMLQDVEARV